MIYISLLCVLTAYSSLLAQTTEDLAVQLSASVQQTPPKITLHWKRITYGKPRHIIFRKAKSNEKWLRISDTLSSQPNSYEDSQVDVDSSYEYQVLAPGDSFTSSGYIYAAIRAPAIHHRGALILLVDDYLKDSCATEIATLMDDLRGDGWQVLRHDIQRNVPDSTIKAAIVRDFESNIDVKAVLILGHLAVPYSGWLQPDGHIDHLGAWPSDVYYGCMKGVWTDSYFHDTSKTVLAANRNLRGDGKYDQTLPPSRVDLQVSRVDFFDMPAFPFSEVQLMKRYLLRNHRYKMDSLTVRHKAIIRDAFGYTIEGFAANGWRNFAPLVSRDSMTAVGYYQLIPALRDSSYQWVYAGGGGTFTSANACATTNDFTTKPNNSIFNMYFGSYFGDWNVRDNLLRAALCADPPSLTNCWAGRPNWQFHHMALGENIGYSVRLTQNNIDSLYRMSYNYAAGGVHIALLGDLSLRTHYVKPASQLSLSARPEGQSVVSWSASPDKDVMGYYVYRSDSAYGFYKRLSQSALVSLSFQDSNLSNGLKYYMVRPVKLQATPSGNYDNLGIGIVDTIRISNSVSSAPADEHSRMLLVYPNPAHEMLQIDLCMEVEEQCRFTLLNTAGQLVFTTDKRVPSGRSSYAFNVNSLPVGAYKLVVSNTKTESVFSWIKE